MVGKGLFILMTKSDHTHCSDGRRNLPKTGRAIAVELSFPVFLGPGIVIMTTPTLTLDCPFIPIYKTS